MWKIIKQELKNLKSPLYRNSIYISASSLIVALAGFIFWNIAARLYSPEDVGIASAVVSALNLIFTMSSLGLNISLIRFYPKYRERAIGSSLILSIIAAFIFSIAYVFIMGGSVKEVFSINFLILFVCFSIVGTCYNMLSTYAIAKRKAVHSFIQSVLFSLRFLFLFILVYLGAYGIVSAFGIGLVLGVIYALIFIDNIKLNLDFEYLKDSLRFSLGNYIANLANSAPNYIMPSIILTMLGEKETAYFYIAISVGILILFVPNAINTSFFVEGSHGLKDLKRTLKKALVFSYLYLVVAVIFIWLFGGYILRFFGEEYVAGFELLKLMVLGGFFIIPVEFPISVLNLQKRVKEVVGINVLKAVLFLGLSYLLVPKFGIEGVGWGWIGGYFVCLCVLILVLKKKF